MRVHHHCPGPANHGIVRHAATLADLTAAHGVEVVHSGPDVLHAQFSDSLHPGSAADAAEAFERWAEGVAAPLVVTLHDVPGGDPDPARDERRGAAYRRVLARCDAVVVSADHEARKVAAFSGVRAHVIPLPLPPTPDPGPVPGWADAPTLGVLGFLYPGKGHEDVVLAASRHPDRPRVVAVGGPSAGHGTLVEKLHALAGEVGVDLVVTGGLDDADFAAAVAAVTVPLAPARRVSASASVLSWVAGGRRPLVVRGEFADELAGRAPGAVTVYDDVDAAVAWALADPRRTTAGGAARWPDVGAEHVGVYEAVLAGDLC